MSTKKEKIPRELLEQKIKAQRQAHKRQADQHKQLMRPFVAFLRKKQLKFSHAQVGSERVEYFRLDQYEKLIQANRQEIDKNPKISQISKKAMNQFIFFKRPDQLKAKYPKNLQPVPSNHSDRKYASFRFDTTQSKHGITIIIILGILLLVLFPIWPYSLKYYIWLISLIILVVIIGITIIRLIVYLILVIFNYHVWIFPNLYTSDGFIESFIPIIQISKGQKSWFNVFIRLFAISSFILLILHVYMNPTFIDDNIAFTKETIMQVHDWGVSKLKNEGNFSQRALTNLETILNETEDVIHYEDENDKVQNFQENEIIINQNGQINQQKSQLQETQF